MMQVARHTTATLALSAFCASQALAVSMPLPTELMLDGKPVDPYCMEHFFGDSSRFEPVNLRDCGLDMILPNEAAHVDEQGSYGYEYSYKESGEGLTRSYIFYRYIGQRHGLPVLLLNESGGGSGRFSALVAVQRDGDTLKLAEEIASGDRCNGGVEAKMEVETLQFTQNITPYDFVALAGDNPHNLSAYDDLESSASSCFGQAHYAEGKLVSISLTGSGEDLEGWTDRIPYQPCFNRLYREYVQQGKMTLSKDELKEFTHNFNTTCVDQPVKSE
jgi:hypothetical protein